MFDNWSASSEKVVGRFAPSPTGISHAGNIFAYLLTWLMVKSQGGEVVLRIEDLDQARSKPEYASHLIEMLEQIGLTYDRGPYFQSDNKTSYETAYAALESAGLIYPCFCSRRDLAVQSAPHGSSSMHVYDRRCENMDASEVASKLKEFAESGRHPAYRLHTDCRDIAFTDTFQGPRFFELEKDCGDFIVRRADSDFAYQLAVVVDDVEEGVNFVSRGCDLIPSTPQQIYLYQLLGHSMPEYAHFPLICAEDGRRLAKRDKDATYDEMKNSLGSPEHVLGHIAYITGMKDEDGPATAEELLRDFDIDAIADRYRGRDKIFFK